MPSRSVLTPVRSGKASSLDPFAQLPHGHPPGRHPPEPALRHHQPRADRLRCAAAVQQLPAEPGHATGATGALFAVREPGGRRQCAPRLHHAGTDPLRTEGAAGRRRPHGAGHHADLRHGPAEAARGARRGVRRCTAAEAELHHHGAELDRAAADLHPGAAVLRPPLDGRRPGGAELHQEQGQGLRAR